MTYSETSGIGKTFQACAQPLNNTPFCTETRTSDICAGMILMEAAFCWVLKKRTRRRNVVSHSCMNIYIEKYKFI